MDLAGFKKQTRNEEIGGQLFCFTQLSMGDIVDAYAWAQEQKDKETKKKRDQAVEISKLVGDISPMDLLKYIDTPMSEKELDTYFETPQGGSYLMYLSLKKKHPDITFADVLNIVNLGNMTDIVTFLFNGNTKPEKKSEMKAAKQSNTVQQ